MEIFPINTCNILKLPNEKYLCTPFEEPGIDINFPTIYTGDWEQMAKQNGVCSEVLHPEQEKARTGRQSKMPKMFASGSLDVRVQQ